MKYSNELLLKDNEEFIQLALTLVNERHPFIDLNTEEYDCKVWRGINGIAVNFNRIIRYVPIGKNDQDFEYDIIVNLTQKIILPFEKPFLNRKFFIPSDEDLKAIAFIKKYFGVFSPDFENLIIEEAEEYKISCTNDASYGYYTLNKKTGKQGSALQGSYLPMTKPDIDGFDEIM
jgi:hypothetical protein